MTPYDIAMSIIECEPKPKDVASIVIARSDDTLQGIMYDLYAKYKIRINYVDGDCVELGKLVRIGGVIECD